MSTCSSMRLAGQPTGGRQAGDDLRLFEVDVESFRPLGEPVQTYTVARTTQEPPRFEDQQGSSADVVETPPVRRDRAVEDDADALPRTASPLALTGLLGLLSFAGVAGLRNLRRRDWL